jgi:integrase
MRAWIYQSSKERAIVGDAARWSVGYYDPDGKRRCKVIGTKKQAEKYARKTEGELLSATYRHNERKTWSDFRGEYEQRILSLKKPNTAADAKQALDQFESIIHPAKLSGVKTATIDLFISRRREHAGRHGEKVSPATVNGDLRQLKAALNVAKEWGYLHDVPKVRMLKEARKLPRYVTPEHFAAIYSKCDSARFPDDQSQTACEWWRSLLTFAYMTGWRISECMALRRTDLDLEARQAITRAADNKGNRDEAVPLHAVLIEQLRPMLAAPLRVLREGETPSSRVPPAFVFHWPYHERLLWTEFARIQKAAGIDLPCSRQHAHSDACHRYGFHDLRRAFASQNAARLTGEALQKLMRHKSYLTTQRYINLTSHLGEAVASLYVPACLPVKAKA